MKTLAACLVLIVDDTETNLDILVETLGEDYEVAVAMDGPTALALAKDQTPDLILLDIMMPGMDGLECFRQLRKDPAGARLPVIFVSVRTEFFNDPAISSDHRVRVLRKPFDFDNLLRMIRDALVSD